jgi:hypothetical protein
MDEALEFVRRGRSYLNSARRAQEPKRRAQYLELAACCFDAAAARARMLPAAAPRQASSKPSRRRGAPAASVMLMRPRGAA